jgi:hypothetical protein
MFHKFGAMQTICDGIKFPSKKEARFYQELKIRQTAGEVLFFLRQVPIHLPGGVKLVIDFEIFNADGTVHFLDTKGFQTKSYRAKKKMVEALYPIKIEER